MGLPVRKTLEVGNRGVQRAYANHIVQINSPQKPISGFAPQTTSEHDRYGYGSEGYGVNNNINNNNYADPYSPTNNKGVSDYGGIANVAGHKQGPLGRVAVGAAFGSDLDDRALKAQMQKAEQANALKMQIEFQKERKLAEKLKRDEDERKELLQFEMQRIELQKAFQKEEQDKKQKLEDDNKRELDKQRQLKQQELEREKQKNCNRKRTCECDMNKR